jgi:hypothetical protein
VAAIRIPAGRHGRVEEQRAVLVELGDATRRAPADERVAVAEASALPCEPARSPAGCWIERTSVAVFLRWSRWIQSARDCGRTAGEASLSKSRIVSWPAGSGLCCHANATPRFPFSSRLTALAWK